MRKFYALLLTLTCLLFLSLSGIAQQRDFWSPLQENSLGENVFANRPKPPSYALFRLDESAFTARMRVAPNEKDVRVSNSSFIISMPYEAGKMSDFRVVDAPIMAPELAAKFPGIHSYAGVSLTDPGVTIRFDISPEGFHGMILSADRPTVYIDPAGRRQLACYQVVSRKDVANYKVPFSCLTRDMVNPTEETTNMTGRENSADDGRLRTYRLALCATGSFSQFCLNGTETTDAQKKAKVLSVMVTDMTRANSIFERDFDVRLILVANNDKIIYLDPSSDPWGDLNAATQITCDNVIGDANYDIGHVVNHSTAGNDGNAGCIACVCSSGEKGSGYTTYDNINNLDFFVVDYLTHEMGHQLGASHTFTYRNEGTISQLEPGSGTTIMGYAGITGATDVQPHSDDYFHAVSIQQVSNYLKFGQGGGCAVKTSTGNSSPTVDAGADYTIPTSTPFVLTGAGKDADATDVLTYAWEQMNVGNNTTTFPNSAAASGPLFRSRFSGTFPLRTFPVIDNILDGSNGNTWERLASVARVLNFRLTVRDNHASGGSNGYDDMIVTVAGSAGPFKVTAPNTTTTWVAGTSQNVTWSVSNTDHAPVNCTMVNILLSTDGGISFPRLLAYHTPNDGSETVSIPAMASSNCRIKVEAVNNIFFDITDENFSITLPQPTFDLGNPASASITCGSLTPASVTLGVQSFGSYSMPVTLSASNVPPGTSLLLNPVSVAPGGSAIISLNNASSLSQGVYDIIISGTSGSIQLLQKISFVVLPGSGPVISSDPTVQANCAGTDAHFAVTASGATSYLWQVSTDGGASYGAAPGTNNMTTYTASAVTTAQNNTLYRVQAAGACGITTSAPALLTVQASPAIGSQPAEKTLCVNSDASFNVGVAGTGIGYLWQVSSDGGANFTTAPGVNNAATYTVNSITAAMNNYRYRAIISGACGPATTSNAAILTVGSPAVITLDPRDTAVCDEVGTATLTAAASGAGTQYQWEVSTNNGANYTPIAGETSTSLVLGNVTSTISNNLYHILASNAICTSPDASNAAKVLVLLRAATSLQASSSALLPGAISTLTATATPGTGVTYSWYQNGVLLPSVTGTTFSVAVTNVGDYQVKTRNETGCTNQSSVVSITAEASSRLFLYPNPNSGQFTLSYYNGSGQASKQTLSIFDSWGKRIYRSDLAVTPGAYTLHPVDLGRNAKGVYYVVLGDAAGKKITDGRVLIL